ncbi:MAG: hypothetical protein B6227_02265 [Fusobacteriia bacterium 4572_74]|nr:MAG: hypothetical protein B6227_02265 [Fusobacteriia bacterium 4572_74]
MRKFNENIDFKDVKSNSPKVLHIDEFKGTSDAGKYQVAICNKELKEAYYIKAYFDRNVTGCKKREAHSNFDN